MYGKANYPYRDDWLPFLRPDSALIVGCSGDAVRTWPPLATHLKSGCYHCIWRRDGCSGMWEPHQQMWRLGLDSRDKLLFPLLPWSRRYGVTKPGSSASSPARSASCFAPFFKKKKKKKKAPREGGCFNITAERSCPLSPGAENATEQKPGGFTRNVSLSHCTYMIRPSLSLMSCCIRIRARPSPRIAPMWQIPVTWCV